MPHKRSPEGKQKRDLRRSYYLIVRRSAFQYGHYDHDKRELIYDKLAEERTVKALEALKPYFLNPQFEPGEVLADPRGRGSLQKPEDIIS